MESGADLHDGTETADVECPSYRRSVDLSGRVGGSSRRSRSTKVYRRLIRSEAPDLSLPRRANGQRGRYDDYFMTISARRLSRYLRNTTQYSLYLPSDAAAAPDEEESPSEGAIRISVQEGQRGRRLFYRQQREEESHLLSATTKVGLKGYAKWKLQWDQRLQRNKRAIQEFFQNFSIWTGSFKTIEGSFGCSVVSYFQFVKWLFLLNVFTFLCILGVVILPQVLLEPSTFEGTIHDGNFSDFLPENLHMAWECSQNYTSYVENNTSMEITSVIVDVFQGTGFLVNTHLFIGHYFNKTHFLKLNEPHYDMALGHLLNTAAYLLITLILMVRYTATGIKESLLNKGDNFYKFFSMIFCGWDYTLSQRKAAAYKHCSLAKEIDNELEQIKRAELWHDMSKQQKAFIYMKRVIVNIVSLACLVGCGVLIYYVVEVWKPQLLRDDTVRETSILSLMVEYLPSVTITGLYLVIPMLFSKIVILEEYSPSTELRINIIRMVLIRLASLIILAVFIFRQISCDDQHLMCGSCNDDIKCWETYVGQELYKLVVLDLIIILATTFLLEFPRRILVTKVKKLKVFQQEFDLPTNVLNIIYSQTLCWWGAFYSPLIPAITVVKLFVLFYCKKVSLMKNQKLPIRSYKAAKSIRFFMMVLMISFFLSTIAVTYTLGWVSPSQGCSPFRVYVTDDYKMFSTVTAAISTLPSAARRFFEIITSWFFYIMLCIILCLSIYFPHVKAAGSQKVIEIYHNQFALLEKDKQFLLNEVNQVLRGRS